MKTDWLYEQMLEAIDGTLSDADRRQFEKALAEDPTAQARFGELQNLVDRMREIPSVDEPLDFTAGVMERIRDIRHPWWVRLRYFLIRPYDFRINILGMLTAAASVAAAMVVVANLSWRNESLRPPAAADHPKQYLMRFSYNDPQAKQVYVAGSFNGWRKQQIPLTDSSGKGLWIGVLPMNPGIYEYMFYVDGRWVEDSHASRFKDDGFGRKNAILELGTGDDLSI
jgi:negative regulator of sigma E activity